MDLVSAVVRPRRAVPVQDDSRFAVLVCEVEESDHAIGAKKAKSGHRETEKNIDLV